MRSVKFCLFLVLACLGSVAPASAQTAVSRAPYTLLPGDQLEVSVWKEPDLQREVIVRPDGRFSFPLVGDVVAIGRSVTEIQDELTTSLARFIPEVVLTVSVKAALGNKIYVIGQVQTPGMFVVNPMVDVVQALAVAGGMTPFAAVNDILILRRVDGRQTVLPFKFGEVAKGRNLEQNIILQAGDIVVVP